ncbi:MAG: hypothetical protein WA825_07485, partial [Steroidobacteraceae bacterium]
VGAARAADTAGAPAAHWVERKLDFTYMGFTTKYSCDGLQDNVRDLLLTLGARKKDLQIQTVGCSRLEGVEPFPGLTAKFWVLEPVSADEAAKGGASVVQATRWQTVNLVGKGDFRAEQGQCELLEQLKRQALPLFTSRNLNFHSGCVPYQVTLGDIRFSVDVLRVAPAPAPTA